MHTIQSGDSCLEGLCHSSVYQSFKCIFSLLLEEDVDSKRKLHVFSDSDSINTEEDEGKSSKYLLAIRVDKPCLLWLHAEDLY